MVRQCYNTNGTVNFCIGVITTSFFTGKRKFFYWLLGSPFLDVMFDTLNITVARTRNKKSRNEGRVWKRNGRPELTPSSWMAGGSKHQMTKSEFYSAKFHANSLTVLNTALFVCSFHTFSWCVCTTFTRLHCVDTPNKAVAEASTNKLSSRKSFSLWIKSAFYMKQPKLTSNL